MPENPHDKEDLNQESENPSEEKGETGENRTWSEDQKKRSYYYDDACGYEIYNPDGEADEET